MYQFISINSERKSQISEEELPEDDKDDFSYFEDNYEDEDEYEYDEPEEREYCD